MKYKVGDKVRLREELRQGAKYNGILFTFEMEKFKEKIGTIDCINEIENTYKIEEFYDCWYSEEMLEPIGENGQNTEKVRSKTDFLQKKI